MLSTFPMSLDQPRKSASSRLKNGGSSNFAYTVAGRTHKGTKISLEVFSTDIRKRLVKNVS